MNGWSFLRPQCRVCRFAHDGQGFSCVQFHPELLAIYFDIHPNGLWRLRLNTAYTSSSSSPSDGSSLDPSVLTACRP